MTRLLRIIVATSVVLVAGCDAQNGPESPELYRSERRGALPEVPLKNPSETIEPFRDGGGEM